METKAQYLRQIALWVGLYLFMAVAPLGVSLLGHEAPSRGFWIEYGVGLGFISIALFGLQFVLTARFRSIARSLGTDAMLQFHRQAGIVAYFFLLGHVTVLLTANPAFVSFFDPSVNLLRSIALVTVLIISTALMVTTLWRKEFKLSYEWWRLGHGLFAFGIVFIGLVHLLQVGFYVDVFWKQAVWGTMTGLAMLLLVHARVYKPIKMSRYPFQISNVHQETDSVWTIEVTPDGHDGLDFDAGQFAWITIAQSPFSMQQHPFSFSSSEEVVDRYQFTIKELGDFTTTIQDIEEGERAYLEGPYGAFTLEQAIAGKLGFVVGGIGITPVMSMLRTLRDRDSDRPITLVYGNPSREEIAFHDEIEEMKEDLNLKVVHVIEEPPEDWEGEEGFITEELLERHLPPKNADVDYFICGPEPMMDLAEMTLRHHEVPLHRIHSERFDIV